MQVSHCFALNSVGPGPRPAGPEVEGVAGILSAYDRSICSVDLHGPTNLAEAWPRWGREEREPPKKKKRGGG